MSLAEGYETHSIEASHDFRVLMNAMSRPGTLQKVTAGTDSVNGLNAGSIVAALTLCDHETTVFVEESDAGAEIREFLSFRCGCLLTEELEQADFAFFGTVPGTDVLERLKIGNSQYPDRSATLIAQVDTMSEGDGLLLEGPGIFNLHALSIPAISSELVEWWTTNNDRFPLGIDMILTTNDAIVGLPRTVKIKER